MSSINIKAFFEFSTVKITKQTLDIQSKTVFVKVKPQKRHTPVCHICSSKYILLKNRENLTDEEQPRLKKLLSLNKAIKAVYILKDYLKRLWQYKYARCAQKFLDYWRSLVKQSKLRPVIAFANTFKRYAYGIINHYRFPIHTSPMEGINNKIKVIKRKAYGFHDVEYFSLVIKSAFS